MVPIAIASAQPEKVLFSANLTKRQSHPLICCQPNQHSAAPINLARRIKNDKALPKRRLDINRRTPERKLWFNEKLFVFTKFLTSTICRRGTYAGTIPEFAFRRACYFLLRD